MPTYLTLISLLPGQNLFEAGNANNSLCTPQANCHFKKENFLKLLLAAFKKVIELTLLGFAVGEQTVSLEI